MSFDYFESGCFIVVAAAAAEFLFCFLNRSLLTSESLWGAVGIEAGLPSLHSGLAPSKPHTFEERRAMFRFG